MEEQDVFFKSMEDYGIDYQSGIERCMNDNDFYVMLMKKFLENKNYDALELAMKSGDGRRAFEEAHALKGVIANLSFNKLYDAIVPLVEALRGEPDMIAANEAYLTFSSEYDELTDFIKSI